MVTISPERAQKNHDKIVSHNAKRLEDIRARIDKRIQAGLGHNDLDEQLSQARIIAERSEALSQKNLDKSKEDAAKQEEANNKRLELKQQEADNKFKKQALREYMGNGGSSSEFEKAWPELRKKILEKATIESLANVNKENQTSIKSI